MRPGDLLVLLHGTYRQPIVVRRSGTPRNFLHIVAENPPYATPPKFPTSGPTIIDAAGIEGPGRAPGRLRPRPRGGPEGDQLRSPRPLCELRKTRDCVVEYVFVEQADGTGIRATGRGNTLYECSVTGGLGGYDLDGSLTDVRWCAADNCACGFRSIGAVAGIHLLQNRSLGRFGGFLFRGPSSDVVLDGNWTSDAGCAYDVAGLRLMLVNNIADSPGDGIWVHGMADVRLLNNSVLRCRRFALEIGGVRSVEALNNVFQAEQRHVVLDGARRPTAVWIDYNIYSRASLPFQFEAQLGRRDFTDLAAWSAATGWDRNSRVAPLVYSKYQDRNGRWRVRELCASVSNFTPHFNVGPLGANAYPYTGGGTYILDVPQNWKPSGEPARRVYILDNSKEDGVLAGRAYWYVARVDYRRRDGGRSRQDLYRVYLPPEQIPAGSFCQDSSTGRVYVRLPVDAADPCPIGAHRKLSPRQTIGYYVGREAQGAAGKYRGKLVTAAVANAMAADGIKETDAVANYFSAVFGTPTLEKGCPILGIYRDADSQSRPEAPLTLSDFGCHSGPGRFDIGAWEHSYYVP